MKQKKKKAQVIPGRHYSKHFETLTPQCRSIITLRREEFTNNLEGTSFVVMFWMITRLSGNYLFATHSTISFWTIVHLGKCLNSLTYKLTVIWGRLILNR